VKNKFTCSVIVALVILLAGNAIAEPVLSVIKVPVPITLKADTGEEMRVDPGYYVVEPIWNKLDEEMRRLQDAETRLAAENKSLRKSASEGPGWGTAAWIGGALAAGFAAGALLR
jgi:hypothetical protein